MFIRQLLTVLLCLVLLTSSAMSLGPPDFYKSKDKGIREKVTDFTRDKTKQGWDYTKKAVSYAREYIQIKDIVQLLSNPQLLKLTEKLLEGSATRFDRAMDAEYILNRVGGGNHRLFDSGHTVHGAWRNIGKMCERQGCSSSEEVGGFLKAFTKDLTTYKGMPFATMRPETYDSIADTLTKIPGVDRKYAYNLLSYDILELVSASIGIVAVLYQFNQQEYQALGSTLGSMGITSIASANPLLAVVIIASTAYSIKTGTFEAESAAKGAGIATLGFVVGSMIAGPVLVELVVVMVVLAMANKYGTKENILKAGNITKEKALTAGELAKTNGKMLAVISKEYGVMFWGKAKDQIDDFIYGKVCRKFV